MPSLLLKDGDGLLHETDYLSHFFLGHAIQQLLRNAFALGCHRKQELFALCCDVDQESLGQTDQQLAGTEDYIPSGGNQRSS